MHLGFVSHTTRLASAASISVLSWLGGPTKARMAGSGAFGGTLREGVPDRIGLVCRFCRELHVLLLCDVHAGLHGSESGVVREGGGQRTFSHQVMRGLPNPGPLFKTGLWPLSAPATS